MSFIRVGLVATILLLTVTAKPACVAPAAPQILQFPSNSIAVGQSYAIIWSRTAGDEGAYIVERSTSASFGAASESQYAGGVAASFVALQTGTYYHRVRAVAGCNPSTQSQPGAPVSVVVTATGSPVVTAEERTSAASRNDGLMVAAPAGESMLIVPVVVRAPGAGGTFYYSKLRINNASSFDTKVDLVCVPLNSDPSTGAPSATVTIRPNDAVSFEDVVGALFPSVMVGSLEVRSPERSADILTVSAPTIRKELNASIGAEYFLPVLRRGEGARLGVTHRVSGAISTGTPPMSGIRTLMIFVETSRSPATTQTAFVVKLFGSDGALLGTEPLALPAGGAVQINGLPQTFGVGTVEDGVLEVSVLSGNGSVATLLRQIDNATNEQAAAYVSEPIATSAGNRIAGAAAASTSSKLFAVIGAGHGKPAESQLAYRTHLGITTGAADAQLTMTFLSDRALAAPRVTTTIPANRTVEYADALAQLFHLSPTVATRGTIVIETMADIQVFGSLFSPDKPEMPVIGNLPVVQVLSEALVSATAGMQRPIYFAGLEQLIDPSKGGRWRLELTELAGGPSVVTVYLYDGANRATPLAMRDFSLYPRQHLVLDTIFQAMGLEANPVTADRRDVQVVVYPKSGRGRVAASATGFYAASGRESKYILTPNGGIAASGTSLAAPLLPPVDDSRHHPARR